MGTCWAACGTFWAGPPPKKKGEQRFVWHGGLPMVCDDAAAEGGLPSYVGMVRQDVVELGGLAISVETWPDYRIGSSVWPSGVLLAHALAAGAPGLPQVRGRHVAELGAGPGLPGLASGLLGAASVALTDRSELVPLLERNIDLNGLRGRCRGEALDWSFARDSPLAAARREGGPLEVLLAADVVYFEEQEPLVDALLALMQPGVTTLALAYRERTPMDRCYLEARILARLRAVRLDYEAPGHGHCEIYVGQLA